MGVTTESEVQSVVKQAEKQYELKVKVGEAQKEIKRLMQIRSSGGKLMQMGWRKWKECYYPAIREFRKDA